MPNSETREAQSSLTPSGELQRSSERLRGAVEAFQSAQMAGLQWVLRRELRQTQDSLSAPDCSEAEGHFLRGRIDAFRWILGPLEDGLRTELKAQGEDPTKTLDDEGDLWDPMALDSEGKANPNG